METPWELPHGDNRRVGRSGLVLSSRYLPPGAGKGRAGRSGEPPPSSALPAALCTLHLITLKGPPIGSTAWGRCPSSSTENLPTSGPGCKVLSSAASVIGPFPEMLEVSQARLPRARDAFRPCPPMASIHRASWPSGSVKFRSQEREAWSVCRRNFPP